MTAPNPQHPSQSGAFGSASAGLDPLPPEFSRELQAIDQMLAACARIERDAMPIGLSQRVFDASVAHLPQPAAQPPLRLVGAGDVRQAGANVGVAADGGRVLVGGWLGRSLWNRVALAASVALAGGVGLWVVMQRSNVPTVPGPNRTHLASNDVALDFEDLNRLAAGLGDFEGEVAYLLEATELDSVYDLNVDLDLLAQQSEM